MGNPVSSFFGGGGGRVPSGSKTGWYAFARTHNVIQPKKRFPVKNPVDGELTSGKSGLVITGGSYDRNRDT